jgi:hypothetical protein
VATLVLAALLLGARAGPAAEPLPVAPPAAGERVRFQAAAFGTGHRTGTVVSTDTDALLVTIAPGADPVRVPLADFERLEVARGRRGHFWTGAIIGLVPGAFLGAAFGWYAGCDDQGADCSAYSSALAGGAVIGAGTALVGGLIGTLVKTDRWEPVPTRHVQVFLVPARGRGVGGGVTIAF